MERHTKATTLIAESMGKERILLQMETSMKESGKTEKGMEKEE